MQCKAKSKRSGERCKKYPMKGSNVCRNHGGASPQAKRKARERLNDLVDPAINILAKAVRDTEENPAIMSSTVLRAARDILDRTGYKPGFDLNLGGALEVNDPGRERLSDEQLDQIIALLEQAEGDQE